MTIPPVVEPDMDANVVVANAVKAFCTHQSQRPDGKAVTAALLELEKVTKQSRQAIKRESLLGTWRLCFSAGKQARYQSGKPMGSGFYIPKIAIAQITFAPDPENPEQLTVANELCVGPFQIRFTGPARYPGKKNLLAFDFIYIEVRCLSLPLYRGAVGAKKRQGQSFEDIAIAKLPFFAFFTATENYIAARGRGGGLAIWVRPLSTTV
ncbi:MAG: hypothetical protein AAGE59_24245 [Cyanobacteria bacterium P01_F01_bin.86]